MIIGARSVFPGVLLVCCLTAASAQNWPSFRGPNASGIASGSSPPTAWNALESERIAWKTQIPGLGHSSPIVWGDRIFVTTAVSSAESSFQPQATSGRSVFENEGEHTWQLLCIDRESGEILWRKTAHRGVPKIKRHAKSSHANSTPVTDGHYIVAFFGSEGLFCYDFDGSLIWKHDLGVLDAGYVGKPQYQWGTASSPIIHDGWVVIQCDSRRESFLAAYELTSGKEMWRVGRDENPSWATPVVYQGENRSELITSSPSYFRGYDPRTGRELWRFLDEADVKVPTPVVGKELIYFSGGAPRGRQFYAIRPGGRGEITSASTAPDSFLAWRVDRGGPYTPTPVVLNGLLYVLSDGGVWSAFEASSGKRVYRVRVPEGGTSYSASPVSASDMIYLADQDGEVHVVRAGPKFELVSSNPMGEALMATPAISREAIYIRGRRHLFAIEARAKRSGE